MSSTNQITDADADDNVYHEELELYPEFNRYQYQFYKDFAEADGIKWAGGGWSYEAIPEGLGDDVYFLAGEPYGAVVAYNKQISRRFLNAADAHGLSSELCGYMVNYWGGLTQNEYVLPDGTTYDQFPDVDFNVNSHICCTHAKWYQKAGELEGTYTDPNGEETPFFGVDIIGGPNAYDDEDLIEYNTVQVRNMIDWIQEVTGREFDDARYIQAVKNEMRSMSLWAKVCAMQKNHPAPLEERRMFSLYAPSIARRSTDESAALYERLHEEVSDMVERKATVSGRQDYRFISDSPPPWAHLDIYRYIRDEYNAVSLGSLYSWGLTGGWRGFDGGDEWNWTPLDTPMERGIEIEDRETAIEEMIKWNMRRPAWNVFGGHLEARKKVSLAMAEEFDVDFVLMHLNRGCEGWAQNQTEVSNHLKRHDIPVLEYEGNQADQRDFDPSELRQKIDMFMEGRFNA
jgi:benzoyl-CoA reductase subunit B